MRSREFWIHVFDDANFNIWSRGLVMKEPTKLPTGCQPQNWTTRPRQSQNFMLSIQISLGLLSDISHLSHHVSSLFLSSFFIAFHFLSLSKPQHKAVSFR